MLKKYDTGILLFESIQECQVDNSSEVSLYSMIVPLLLLIAKTLGKIAYIC